VIASLAALSFGLSAMTMAEPAVIRAARVIQCEAGDDKRPAVVTGVTMTPDGKTIAAATDDHRVTMWDVATAEQKDHFDGHGDWVRSVVLSQDGNICASGGCDRAIRVWDVHQHHDVFEVPACDNTVASVCFHPNSHQLALVGFSNSLKIINTSTGQISQELVCPGSDMRTVAFSPDGARMAVAGRNGKIRVWNVNNGTQERDIDTDGRRIRTLGFSPDGARIAAAGNSQSVRMIDIASGETVFSLSTRPSMTFALLFLENNRLATGGTDNRIWIWDLETRQAVTQLVGHTGTVASLACDRSGATLVSGSYDTTVRIWNLTAGSAPATASRGALDSAR